MKKKGEKQKGLTNWLVTLATAQYRNGGSKL
jgi:hypothetical protein